MVKKSPSNDTEKQTTVKEILGKMKRADSFPDDASFVANLKERQKESEVRLILSSNFLPYTVKPVNKGYPRIKLHMVFIDKWSLFGG